MSMKGPKCRNAPLEVSRPSAKKGGKRQFVSAPDFWKLNRNNPNEQTMAMSMIKRFDRGSFQQMVVNWVIDSNLSFLQADNNDYVRSSNSSIHLLRLPIPTSQDKQYAELPFGNSTHTKTRLKQFYGERLVKYILHLMVGGPETVILYMA
jgi:hypothetical protein